MQSKFKTAPISFLGAKCPNCSTRLWIWRFVIVSFRPLSPFFCKNCSTLLSISNVNFIAFGLIRFFLWVLIIIFLMEFFSKPLSELARHNSIATTIIFLITILVPSICIMHLLPLRAETSNSGMN